jgi:hypothetical protein
MRVIRIGQWAILHPLDFSVDIPSSLLQVLDLAVFFSGSPDVFDGVATVEVEMLGDLDALDAAGVALVMRWLID